MYFNHFLSTKSKTWKKTIFFKKKRVQKLLFKKVIFHLYNFIIILSIKKSFLKFYKILKTDLNFFWRYIWTNISNYGYFFIEKIAEFYHYFSTKIVFFFLLKYKFINVTIFFHEKDLSIWEYLILIWYMIVYYMMILTYDIFLFI